MAKQSRNRTIALAAAAGVVLLAALTLRATMTGNGGAGSKPPAARGGVSNEDGSPVPARSGRREEHKLGANPAVKDAEAAEYLRETFGATITNKHTQIKTLEKLINYLMQMYPDDWEAHLQALLAQAFPDLADELYGQYQRMTAYNDWLKAHRGELAEMTYDERRDALRDARNRFFGVDNAAEIFEEQQRNEHIYDAMDSINKSPDAPIDEKLDTYLDAINEAYGEKAPEFIERRQTELMTKFLELPSVQDDLHALSASAREAELDAVRKTMGLDDAARERWRELDGQRDQAWETGQRYMQQRDQITRTYQGDDQARRLGDLRTQTFGTDADTIAAEEAAGFFRFGHNRVFGKE